MMFHVCLSVTDRCATYSNRNVSSHHQSFYLQLKPKATALFVLVCLAIYDVFISPPVPISPDHDATTANAKNATPQHEHEKYNQTELDEFWNYDALTSTVTDDLAASLRCYRGPALLAWTMFCAAYSLRIWRRNGVACDELLFLPGTPHEFRLIGGRSSSSSSSSNGNDPNQKKNSTHGDGLIESTETELVEIGLGGITDDKLRHSDHEEIEEDAPSTTAQLVSPIKSCFSEGDAAAGAAKSPAPQREHTRSLEFQGEELQSLHGTDTPYVERRPIMLNEYGSNSAPTMPTNRPLTMRGLTSMGDSSLVFVRDTALKGIDMLIVRDKLRPPPLNLEDETSPGGSSGTPLKKPSSTAAADSNEVYDRDYAPSAPSVLGASLDLSLPVLFNFHMFVVLMKNHYNKQAAIHSEEDNNNGDVSHDGDDGTKVDVKDDTWLKPPQLPPKILPLFFITPLIIRSIMPPRQRRRFYKTILQGTAFSIFKQVRFRDAFVADCITSMVRPIVDLVYMLAYYFIAWFGLFSGKYDLDKAGYILSKSMLMHGLILPLLSILPLFVKFLQTLRQAYDTGKRWPYLGNAFKYFTAGLVILYGMTHAAEDRSSWWRYSFAIATLYQIIWDSFIDWELLVFAPGEPFQRRGSSLLVHLCRKLKYRWDQIRLRPKRLFEEDSFYWKAFVVNAALRFCWMAGFIPAYRVSITDGSTQVTFVDKAHGWSFVLIASLEILRLTLWGIIKLELETIKLTNGGESDLAMASIAEEYLREGKWKVPPRDPQRASTLTKLVSRCRRSIKPNKTPLEVDAHATGLGSKEYSQVEQSEEEPALSLASPKEHERERYKWMFCISVSKRFIRGMFVLELLLWPCTFLVLSYYVILIE